MKTMFLIAITFSFFGCGHELGDCVLVSGGESVVVAKYLKFSGGFHYYEKDGEIMSIRESVYTSVDSCIDGDNHGR